MSWWSRRRDAKRAQRNIGAVLRDDRLVLPGTIVQDRRGQRWQAMMLSGQHGTGYELWWREIDAQTFRPPTRERHENALDGKQFPTLDDMGGPLQVASLPPRLFNRAAKGPQSLAQ